MKPAAARPPSCLLPFALCLLSSLVSPSCGYRLSGRSGALPKQIKTIAIPAFGNATTRYKLTQHLASALTREFISRTRYDVVADPAAADAVLEGWVSHYMSYPVVYDPATSRASTVQINVILGITLRDRSSGAVLFTNPNLEVRERYELSVDQRAYFEESDAALERAGREVARRVVSAILEHF